jgi:hypothetical protein
MKLKKVFKEFRNGVIAVGLLITTAMTVNAQSLTMIYNATDLANISSNLAGNYKLANDIDMSTYGAWTPIGTFTGTLDGDGYKISNLQITVSGGSIGLFTTISGTTASVSNLGLENVNVNVSTTTPSSLYMGALAAKVTAGAQITNCWVTGSVTGNINNGTADCFVGGLIGNVTSDGNPSTKVEKCYSTANVSAIGAGNYAVVGGLVGILQGGASVEHSYAISDVSVTGHSQTYIGGLIGQARQGGSAQTDVMYCYAAGTIDLTTSTAIGTAAIYAGGLVGFDGPAQGPGTQHTEYTSVYYDVTMASTNVSIPNPVGWPISSITINNNAAQTTAGMQTPTTFSAWVSSGYWNFSLGYPVFATQAPPISICTPADLILLANFVNTGHDCSGVTFTLCGDIDLTGYSWTPIGNTSSNAFKGTFDGANYTVDFGTRTITGDGTDGDATSFGLFGYIDGATVENLKVQGNLTSAHAKFVAGIVAQATNGATIDNCSFSGSITIADDTNDMLRRVAGICGNLDSSTISNCYNSADITATQTTAQGDNRVGGIVASAAWNMASPLITNCYNTGDITITSAAAEGYAGGIAGLIFNNGTTFSYCYNTGDIELDVHNDGAAGGIVGWSGGDRGGAISITKCYNIGDISNNLPYTGGIIGVLICDAASTLENLYNTGSITGTDNNAGSVGGIAGSIEGNASSTLTKCYNVGAVSSGSASDVAAIVGNTSTGGTPILTNCYYDSCTVGQLYARGTDTTGSRNTGQMMTITTYANFDFANTWEMGPRDLYPALQNMPVPVSAGTPVQNWVQYVVVFPKPTVDMPGTDGTVQNICQNDSIVITFTGLAPFDLTYTVNGSGTAGLPTGFGSRQGDYPLLDSVESCEMYKTYTTKVPAGACGTFAFNLTQVADARGCPLDGVITATYNVYAVPHISMADTTICNGESAVAHIWYDNNCTPVYPIEILFKTKKNGVWQNQDGTAATDSASAFVFRKTIDDATEFGTGDVAFASADYGVFEFNLISISDNTPYSCKDSTPIKATVTVNQIPTVTATLATANGPAAVSHEMNSCQGLNMKLIMNNRKLWITQVGSTDTIKFAFTGEGAGSILSPNFINMVYSITKDGSPLDPTTFGVPALLKEVIPIPTFNLPYDQTYTITVPGAGVYKFTMDSLVASVAPECYGDTTGGWVVVNVYPQPRVSMANQVICYGETANVNISYDVPVVASEVCPITIWFKTKRNGQWVGGSDSASATLFRRTVTASEFNNGTVAIASADSGVFEFHLVSVEDVRTCANNTGLVATVTVNEKPTITATENGQPATNHVLDICAGASVSVTVDVRKITFTAGSRSLDFDLRGTGPGITVELGVNRNGSGWVTGTTAGNILSALGFPTGNTLVVPTYSPFPSYPTVPYTRTLTLPTTAGTYGIRITSITSAGCSGDTLNSWALINVYPQPNISLNTPVCQNTDNEFTVTPDTSKVHILQWDLVSTTTVTPGLPTAIRGIADKDKIMSGSYGTFVFEIPTGKLQDSVSGCTNLNPIRQTIVVNPEPIVRLVEDTLCKNENNIFAVYASNDQTEALAQPVTISAFTTSTPMGITAPLTITNNQTIVSGSVGTFLLEIPVGQLTESTNGCKNTVAIKDTVVVHDLPQVRIDATPSDMCLGEKRVFTFSNGKKPYTLSFTDNVWGAGQIVLPTTHVEDTLQIASQAVGTYHYNFVSLVDDNGCAAATMTPATWDVVVHALPTVRIVEDSICHNAEATVELHGSPVFNLSFTPTIGLPTSFNTGDLTQTGSADAAGDYTYTAKVRGGAVGVFEFVGTITDAFCTSGTLKDTVKVNPVPTISFAPDAVCEDGAVIVTFTGGTDNFTADYRIQNLTSSTPSTLLTPTQVGLPAAAGTWGTLTNTGTAADGLTKTYQATINPGAAGKWKFILKSISDGVCTNTNPAAATLGW